MTALPHEFAVPGSPVSVNRYGTAEYRNWRAQVLTCANATWSAAPLVNSSSVTIRYFWHLDRRKDVDNILKAILDGLDGKAGPGPKATARVLHDDRDVERVISQRTRLSFSTRLNGRRLRPDEFQAALLALSHQAAVFVSVDVPPNHARSVTA